jgi:hypothetical protein
MQRVCLGLLGALAASCVAMAQTSDLDLSDVPVARSLDVGFSPAAPASDRKVPYPPAREARGNPLWMIPLETLSATRDRPIFLPSRRPPAAPGPSPVAAVAAAPAEPDRPRLALLGTVIGQPESIAVFATETRGLVRLRPGQAYAGWTLHSVKLREAILHKDSETVVLALPARAKDQAAPASPRLADAERVPTAFLPPPALRTGTDASVHR